MTIRIDGSERMEDRTLVLHDNWGNTNCPRAEFRLRERGRLWWIERRTIWILNARKAPIKEPWLAQPKSEIIRALELGGPVADWLREVHHVAPRNLVNYAR